MKTSESMGLGRKQGKLTRSAGTLPACCLGLWEDGKFFNLGDREQSKHRVEVQALDYQNPVDGYRGVYTSFTLFNPTLVKQNIKIICMYHETTKLDTTAFYSPQEDSIIQLRDDHLAYMSGTICQGRIGQYSIIEASKLKYEGCFKSMERGELYFSPLAKGNLFIIYTLETIIEPRSHASGAAWAVLSPCREKAVEINNSLRKKRTSILL
ncbi:hypothetical protein [Peribacillus deserti]|uniref:Uncharacterized protein n=1 Tax=Peribacillus deserti TaxID=673318 RepID=A0A2N5M4A4_9BACI|nr:hypothetical protein [Peribacillus deserti]PLT29198.1 hypothetical protein CUU66_14735 [Peribacillus deserti]